MPNKTICAPLLLFTVLLSACGALGTPAETPDTTPDQAANLSKTPNIVLILSDDQRVDDIANMDNLLALAAEGATFSNAYVTTPLCCVSRSSILTGEYAHNHGVLGNMAPYGFKAFEDGETVATWLHTAGYKTALIGKYLNGYDKTKGEYIPTGWDTFQTFVKGPAYYKYTIESFVDGVDNGILKYESNEDDYSTEVLTQNALAFINSTEDDDSQPFFLFFTPYAPHDPATPPEKYMNEPANFDPTVVPSYNEEDVSDKSAWVKGLTPLSAEDQENLKGFGSLTAGTLKDLDNGIGKILDTLKANGEMENTVIIYMSDNGIQWGEHRIVLTKNAPYEESVHVPLIVYDGRAKEGGGEIAEPALNIDLAPSILEWAGLTLPSSIDGKSLISLIEGVSDGWRTSFLTEGWKSPEGVAFTSIHDGNFVYIDFGAGEVELYNLVADPYQLENLAGDGAYAEEIKKLQDELMRLKACKGAEC